MLCHKLSFQAKLLQLQSYTVHVLIKHLKATLNVCLTLALLEVASSMAGHPGILSFQLCFFLIQLHELVFQTLRISDHSLHYAQTGCHRVANSGIKLVASAMIHKMIDVNENATGNASTSVCLKSGKITCKD